MSEYCCEAAAASGGISCDCVQRLKDLGIDLRYTKDQLIDLLKQRDALRDEVEESRAEYEGLYKEWRMKNEAYNMAYAITIPKLERELEEARALVKWVLDETPPKSLSGDYNLAGLKVHSMRQAINVGCLGCRLDEALGDTKEVTGKGPGVECHPWNKTTTVEFTVSYDYGEEDKDE